MSKSMATNMYVQNASGIWVPVSSTNPVPITGSISASNPSVGTTGAAAPTSATEIGTVAQTSLPTAVTAGQLVAHLSDKYGRGIVMGGLRELKGRQHTTITSSVAETTIATAIVGVFIDVYRIIINNSSATACTVTIKDSTAGTIVDVISVPAGDVRGWSVPQDSGATQTAVNNNWTATCSASVASIDITVLFVQNK